MDVLKIELAITTLDDLNSLFVFQIDHQANFMAAFTSTNYADKDAYISKYSRFLSDPDIRM